MNTATIDTPASDKPLARFLETYSTEVTTRDQRSIESVEELLPRGAEIFVASLQKDAPERQIKLAKRLAGAGLTPVPHIVARAIATPEQLDEHLKRLTGEAGVDRALVLGGDRDRAVGLFESSLQLIETGLFQKHGLKRLFIGCYPEGHPRIAADVLERALLAKSAAAEAAGLELELVSQFCFDAQPVIALAERLRALGVTAALRVGVAGPAEIATLVKYAIMCGVGASLRALRERQDLARSTLAGETPETVLEAIACAQSAQPELGLSGAHFFTFGSLANSVRWVESRL